jgi:fanconi-associated nuclease 1
VYLLKVPDRARFLLVRLILRKREKIHRLSKLTFQSELGPHISDAIRELCRGQKVRTNLEEREIIDLTGEDDDQLQEILTPLEPDLTYFAEDETSMSLDELLQCLSLDEINSVAKELRLRVPKSVSSHALSACNTLLFYGQRRVLVADILRYASTQGTLHFQTTLAVAKGKLSAQDNKPLRQSLLSFGTRPLKSAADTVRRIVLQILSMYCVSTQTIRLISPVAKCIRVNPDITKYFRRLNIIFFRE